MKKLSLVIGFSGSGKTTFSSNKEGKVLHIDAIRKAITGSYATKDNENELVTEITKKTISYYLHKGADVVLDASLLSSKNRKIYIDLAKKFEAEVDIYWLDIPFETILARITERNKIVEKDRQIDLQYLYQQTEYFEMPTYSEGIKNIIRISEGNIL